jgi:hypothetical protein
MNGFKQPTEPVIDAQTTQINAQMAEQARAALDSQCRALDDSDALQHEYNWLCEQRALYGREAPPQEVIDRLAAYRVAVAAQKAAAPAPPSPLGRINVAMTEDRRVTALPKVANPAGLGMFAPAPPPGVVLHDQAPVQRSPGTRFHRIT